MKKSELRQIIKEEISKLIESKSNIEQIEYKDKKYWIDYQPGDHQVFAYLDKDLRQVAKVRGKALMFKVKDIEDKLIKENYVPGGVAKGELKLEKYKDDEIFYVSIPKIGDIPVLSKVIEKMGENKFNNLVGKTSTWRYEVWDFLQSKPSDRFRITQYIS